LGEQEEGSESSDGGVFLGIHRRQLVTFSSFSFFSSSSSRYSLATCGGQSNECEGEHQAQHELTHDLRQHHSREAAVKH